jgi:hypothetical protein
MKALNYSSGKLIEMADAAYYFSVKGSSYGETNTIVDTKSAITRLEPYPVSGYEIVAEGEDNKFGYQLAQLLEDNNLGLGVLRRQRGLQYGQGLGIYQVKRENGRHVVEWLEDANIEGWLEQWDHEEYLINVLLDLLVKQEYYTKIYRNRAPRVGGTAKVAALEHVGFADCRRQWPDAKNRIANIFVADWREGEPQQIVRYPVFDPAKATNMRREAYMMWSAFYQPGRTNKTHVVPGYQGARKWMQRSNVAPDILKAQTDNGMNIKWSVISPQSYWDNKREILMEQCKQKKVPYKEDMLEDLKDDILRGLSNVLAGVENVGKFFHSEAVRQELGVGKSEVLKWEIQPIDMKVKDFTDAQIKISEHAQSATTSAMGLHPSMANIVINGEMDSGSQMLYAYKLFLATETKVIEKKALEVMNMMKRLYFPNVPGKFGFYHDIVKREEDITPGERVMNNED